jgi:hypothetical protein
MATVRFLSWSVIPLGALIAGALGGWIGVRGALVTITITASAAPAAVWFSALRHQADLEPVLTRSIL